MEYSRNFYQIVSNEQIFKKILEEKKTIGYYSLPFHDLTEIEEYAKTIKKKNILVVGIGGSSLGAKAIHQFLITSRNFLNNLVFLDTIDPLKISCLIGKINLEDSHFIFISKSGNTIEPLSILRYLDNLVGIKENNSTTITEKNSPLHRFAKKRRIRSFEIPKNVGGRFSVFSVAGLLPLAITGVDISQLCKGCQIVHNSFFNKEYYFEHIINKARFIVENKSRFNNNVIFSYSSIFEYFNKWFVQLWAESLGKKNINGTRQGLTPISLLGPEDQHSFLQLIIDGPRDKTVTFFKVNNLGIKTVIPANSDLDSFDRNSFSEISFNDLINSQADATVESILNQGDIPCDVITIPSVDELNIAKLMYRYQLLVSSIGAFLQINAYDQPGVEAGKQILKQKLNNHD